MIGIAVIGDAVVGVDYGLPGVTVFTELVGAQVVGIAVVGMPDGFPGVTVGPAVVGWSTMVLSFGLSVGSYVDFMVGSFVDRGMG